MQVSAQTRDDPFDTFLHLIQIQVSRPLEASATRNLAYSSPMTILDSHKMMIVVQKRTGLAIFERIWA
jgi:hypothetical protein